MARPASSQAAACVELRAVDEGAVPASALATSRLFVLPVATRQWVLTDNTYIEYVNVLIFIFINIWIDADPI